MKRWIFATARGCTIPPLDVRIRSASRSSSRKAAERGGGREPAVDAVESVEERDAAPPDGVRPGVREQRLCGERDRLADEPFPRAEPAVDRRAPEPELGSDRLYVDTLSVQVAA